MHIPSRRRFLIASGLAGAGLLIGFGPAARSAQDFAPNQFILVGTDGSVTLTMPKIEMGQGTYTAMTMLLAEELEVDPAAVTLRHAPPDATLYGGARHDQFTGASLSMVSLWEPLRRAGASARVLLIEAAAREWQVPAGQCRAALGVVTHVPTGRALPYARLADAASRLAPPRDVILKQPDDFRLIGKPLHRLDAAGKVDGSARFGIDVRLPGMLYAAVQACPVPGGRLRSVDEAPARARAGVHSVVRLPDAVAVIAANTWLAQQALMQLRPVWDDGANGELDTAAIERTMRAALARTGKTGRDDGDAAGVIAADPRRVTATYLNPMLAHAAMEPLSCTVHVRDGAADVWVGTQVPARARDAVARVLGLPPAQVTLHGHLLGGAFGRRLHTDFVEQAALVARGAGVPVKLTWSREEDIRHDSWRGLYVHELAASLGPDGLPVALAHKLAGPSNLAHFAPGRLRDGLDETALEGSANLPYAIPHVRAEFVREDGPVVTGFWRGVGPTRNVFALESFIDELAHRAGRDPLRYRLALLEGRPRVAAVLREAARMAGWGQPLPASAGRAGRGIALLDCWGTALAQVVELQVTDDGSVRVRRVSCAVDCGVPIHPDTIRAQIEGGIVFGLSALLYGRITFAHGRVEQSNFHDYPVLRLPDAPVVDVTILPSTAAPGGIGEPGTACVGPAFGNALFAATGVRLRDGPVDPQRFRKS